MSAARQLAQRASQVCAAGDGDVPSPCVSVCRVDPRTGWCEGCYRTLDEIAAWSRMGSQDKRAVWGRIAERALTDTSTRPAVVSPSPQALFRTQRQRAT